MATLLADSTPGLWSAAPGTGGTAGDGTLVARDTNEKLGFYGTTPIAKQTIPTAATGTQIAAALAALGLVNLS
jgi:hypothetical protein